MSKIPKIIHYCWFGPKQLPQRSVKFIHGWHLKNPSFKIIRWSENNFDVNKYLFTRRAYREKNWAAISDYVRLIVLKKYGGIYLDTDVQDLKSLSPLLRNNSFMGMENIGVIASGLIYGCRPNDSNVNNFLEIYNKIGKSNNFKKHANDQVYISTMYFTKYGFKRKNTIQELNGCIIYPTNYFCPERRGYKKIRITSNTYTFHHYDASWTNGNNENLKTRINILLGDEIIRLFGIHLYRELYNFYSNIKEIL